MSKLSKILPSLSHLFEESGLDTLYLYYRRHRGNRRQAAIDKYLGTDVPEAKVRRLKRQMRHAFLRYGWSSEEFFMMNYPQCTPAQRSAFVPDLHMEYFCKRVNPASIQALLNDKAEAYRVFRQYYHREVCGVMSWDKDGERFADFVLRHDRFIVKPVSSSMGVGIKILDHVTPDIAESIAQEYPGGFVAEELIRQSEKMSELYPLSVNTIRVSTFRTKEGVRIARPFLKVGRGGNVVDNGGRGGLLCAIDFSSGKVTAVRDEFCQTYTVHPDTGKALIEFQIPRWEEALSLAKELSDALPQCPYVGWDLALTDDGWVMVEGNSRGQFIGFQLPEQKGFRSEFVQIRKQMPSYK